MPLTLILMRHAKSAWGDPTQDDFERPLNGRGRKSAPAIANWLVIEGYLPDVVLVSGARRTVETWERMAPSMPDTAVMESVPALYLAAAETMLNVLRTQTAKSAMVICHNPGIADFAQRIVDAPPSHPKFFRYPTAATSVIRFDFDSWDKIDWGTGRLQAFTVPRDLLEAE